MALSKVQRGVLEEAIRKAERGPSFGPGTGSDSITIEEAQRRAKNWAGTWIAGAAQMVLDNDAGKVSARQLGRWCH